MPFFRPGVTFNNLSNVLQRYFFVVGTEMGTKSCGITTPIIKKCQKLPKIGKKNAK